MSKNEMFAKLRSGQPVLGGWIHLADSLSAEIVARLDVDYVVIDMQHGTAAQSGIVPMLQGITAAGKTPLVRIPFRDLGLAQRILDAGAEGLIVPMVNSAAQALAVVESVRYPPLGERSFGPVRSQMLLGRDPDAVNAEVICLVQIETKEAMANLEEIVETPGIDGVYVGPADLAISHGLSFGGQLDKLDELLARIVETCEQFEVIAGIHCFSGESALRARSKGFVATSVGSDAVWLRAGYSTQLALAQGLEPETTVGYY